MIVRILIFIASVLLLSDLVDCSNRSHGGALEVLENIVLDSKPFGYVDQNQQICDNRRINFIDIYDKSYTVYDAIFWVLLTWFIFYTIYVRAKTNFRVDYPGNNLFSVDEVESPLYSVLISMRKIITPDPYLDPEMKKADLMSGFSNGPIIAFWILWYSVAFFSLDEMFGVTYKHIEDLSGLMVALFIYFINIVGTCIVYDTCTSAPMKYYEE